MEHTLTMEIELTTFYVSLLYYTTTTHLCQHNVGSVFILCDMSHKNIFLVSVCIALSMILVPPR